MGERCKMLIVWPDAEDRECGQHAEFRYIEDRSHTICRACYDSFADDPDIQAEYEPL